MESGVQINASVKVTAKSEIELPKYTNTAKKCHTAKTKFPLPDDFQKFQI